MKRSLLLSLAAASLLLSVPAHAVTRPTYGGTLRVEMSATLNSLEPTESNGLAADTAEIGRAHV